MFGKSIGHGNPMHSCWVNHDEYLAEQSERKESIGYGDIVLALIASLVSFFMQWRAILEALPLEAPDGPGHKIFTVQFVAMAIGAILILSQDAIDRARTGVY